jgi:HPt (histidine-containing phosphotransfer) domain-containing protein
LSKSQLVAYATTLEDIVDKDGDVHVWLSDTDDGVEQALDPLVNDYSDQVRRGQGGT